MMANQESSDALEMLIQHIKNCKDVDFYRRIWGDVDTSDIDNLPLLTVDHLIETPLQKRTYKDKKGITKIVKNYARPFLIRFCLEDLKKEKYVQNVTGRPLILLSDPHDALEKSLWWYEHDIIPLIGEHTNLSVTVFTAVQYDINVFMTDMKMLETFAPFLEKKLNIKNIQLILLGSVFDEKKLNSVLQKYNSVSVVLSLSETGAIAHSCRESLIKGELVFHPVPDVFIEIKESLIMTKLHFLTTPLIRYNTGIMINEIKKICSCKQEDFSFQLK